MNNKLKFSAFISLESNTPPLSNGFIVNPLESNMAYLSSSIVSVGITAPFSYLTKLLNFFPDEKTIYILAIIAGLSSILIGFVKSNITLKTFTIRNMVIGFILSITIYLSTRFFIESNLLSVLVLTMSVNVQNYYMFFADRFGGNPNTGGGAGGNLSGSPSGNPDDDRSNWIARTFGRDPNRRIGTQHTPNPFQPRNIQPGGIIPYSLPIPIEPRITLPGPPKVNFKPLILESRQVNLLPLEHNTPQVYKVWLDETSYFQPTNIDAIHIRLWGEFITINSERRQLPRIVSIMIKPSGDMRLAASRMVLELLHINYTMISSRMDCNCRDYLIDKGATVDRHGTVQISMDVYNNIVNGN